MILTTGSSGFIGRSLMMSLKSNGRQAIGMSRSRAKHLGIPFVMSPELGPQNNWAFALKKIETVIHLAARAHITDKKSDREVEDLYQRTNTEGTANLARQAAAMGVRHFIFVSSIGAVAENSKKPLTTNSQNTPITPYGRSKLGAEKVIKKVSLGTKMKYTIIRPPLVYGPGNPGNMAILFKIVDTSIPLPLSALDSNRRSFLGISNLIDVILLCLENPGAVNKTFHVSDDDDISTAALLRRMGKALGKPVRNLPLPKAMLKTGLHLIGKGEWVDKLFGDLRVDISETKRLLGWKPKVTMEEELERAAKWWRESRQGRL